MGVQSGINQGLGSIAGAVALGKHIKNQNEANIKAEEANKKAEEANKIAEKELKIKNIENEQKLNKIETSLLKQSRDIITKAGSEGLDALAKNPEDPNAVANELMDNKLIKANEDVLGTYAHKMLNEAMGKPIGQLNKSLEKRQVALNTVENEIEARKELMQGIELQKRKVGIR